MECRGRSEVQTTPELRHYRAEMRVAGDDKAPVLEGHAAVFNQLSEDFGGWRERIAPGAFADTIGRDDIRALWNHESGLVLGRTSSGTLRLSEDPRGLAFRIALPGTSWVRDRLVSVKRGDVTGCSFGFFDETPDEEMWSKDPASGQKIRTLKKVTLLEVSPGVTFPAYSQTDVALASLRRWLGRNGNPALDLLRRRLRLHEHSLGFSPALRAEQDLRRRRLRLQEMTLFPAGRSNQDLDSRRRRLRLKESKL